MKNNNTATGGIGFGGLLTIVFIVLKLCNVITWPWIWILAPLWIPLVMFIVFTLILFLLNR